ncbi:MAG: FAD-dependent oxidoreductase [Bacteroidetes bacterium]|nr:FAD-dependent oxidoreductase [Bacteroidota bacterium]MBU2586141.1 FAD-dependent oxidoreductase [Bacteroidota bacterium]
MNLQEKYDIIVAGAGIAGISAAVKLARNGASVLLVEHYGFVGGMSTAGMVSPFMKHLVNGEKLVRGIFEEIENEMIELNGMIDNGFYASVFRLAAFNLLNEAGVTLLLHAEIVSVKREKNKIKSISTLIAGETRTFQGEIFIDTTGDAQLVYLGGFPWRKGDEKTGYLQALTLFFRMGGIDVVRATAYVKAHKDDFFPWMDYNFDLSRIISVAGYFRHVKKAIKENRLSDDVRYIFYTTLPESGEASFNTSNILNLDGSASSDLTKAEFIGREQVHQVVRLLQDEIPGFENSYLIESAVQIGVRETRRAVGDYVMEEEDITKCRKFPDAIARGCYGIDIHAQRGEENRLDEILEGEYYEIPIRSLIVSEAENLLVAGRCISATRKAHGALRIMPTSAATGEACGSLASLAKINNCKIRDVKFELVKQSIKHNLSSK